MSLNIAVFLVGIVMLALFLWYFGCDEGKRKRWVGTALTLLVAAFCSFAIFYTGNLPDSYSILLQPADPEAAAETLVSDENRTTAETLIRDTIEATDPETEAELALASSKNTISLSRTNLTLEEVEAAVAKVRETTGLEATVTVEPKPTTQIKKGIDLQGGSAFVVQIGRADADQAITDTMKEEAIAVFENRLNPDGTKDLVITTQGADRVLIQMPGVQPEEIEGIRKRIQQVAKLEFRLVHPESDRLLGERSSPAERVMVPGYVEMPFRPERDGTSRGSLLVTNKADITGSAVASTGVNYDIDGWNIWLNTTSEGADRFYEITSKNVNERLAIIMDGEILSAPAIRSALSNNIKISGDFTNEEAFALASALENPLEITPKIVDERSVSATYGENTIRQGILAALVGLGITLVFCVIYYKVAGLVALVGLTINLLILMGALAASGSTLTMPGIAGIILTIGIAIDANILIFERLKEELKAGKTLGGAVKAAYEKAFSAIVDANITTLITAILLLIVASSVVKGFALVLTIGILASLFAALLVTRVCFMWLLDLGLLKSLNIRTLVPEGHIDFLSKRRMAAVISAVLLLTGIVTYIVRGPDALGVDFRGGEMITLVSNETVTKASVIESLADLPVEKFVQSQASPTGEEFITIRTAYLDPEVSEISNAQRIIDEIQKDLGAPLADLEKESVGPLVGRELAFSSLLALGLGLIGILLYLTVRFEFSFALGAIAALIHDVVIALGIVALLGYELQLIHVGAFLTIAGYSINDTIVVFDRIRETLRQKKGDIKTLMNLAIRQTLGRTILTSLTTLVVVVVLALFGGPSLRDFSVTIIIGVLIGTYSSIFVAAPIVLWWSRRTGRNLRSEILDADAARAVDTSGIEREVPVR